jgi:hypothetical protein
MVVLNLNGWQTEKTGSTQTFSHREYFVEAPEAQPKRNKGVMPALVNPRARGNKLRGMKSLLYHALGVKGFRCLRTRYEGGETIFEVEPEKEPEVLRRHGYRWRTVRSVSIGLKRWCSR